MVTLSLSLIAYIFFLDNTLHIYTYIYNYGSIKDQ